MTAQQLDVAAASQPVIDGLFVGFDRITVLLRILAVSSKLYFNGRLEVVRNVMVNSITIYMQTIVYLLIKIWCVSIGCLVRLLTIANSPDSDLRMDPSVARRRQR